MALPQELPKQYQLPQFSLPSVVPASDSKLDFGAESAGENDDVHVDDQDQGIGQWPSSIRGPTHA